MFKPMQTEPCGVYLKRYAQHILYKANILVIIEILTETLYQTLWVQLLN